LRPDVMVERFDQGMPGDPESAAQIIPDRDAEFVASLDQAEEGIAAVAPDVAACPGADLAPGDMAPDVVLRAVGVQRDLRPLQHQQQFRLVGMQPRQQAVQGDEAGAAQKNAVEPGAQRDCPALVWFELISLQAGIELPDQPADPRLSGTMLILIRRHA